MTREEWQAKRQRQVDSGERFWDMADLTKNQSVHVIIGRMRLVMKLLPNATQVEVFRACWCAYYGPTHCKDKDFDAEVRLAHKQKAVPLYVGRSLLVDPEPPSLATLST